MVVVVVVVVVVVGDGSRRVCSSSTSGENERPDMRLETKRHNKPTETEKSKRRCIMRCARPRGEMEMESGEGTPI